MSVEIIKRLRRHYDAAVEHYGENAVLGVFLYGSQNYNTNTKDSDVDTKCILVPNLYHLACKPYEIKHLNVEGEVCECMTIQHMVANWKKQNINFVEIMFTPYCIINDLYVNEWFEFIGPMREKIARYDIKKAIISMGYQALHTYQQDPTDFKKQMNTIRIYRSLRKLVDNEPSYWNIIHFSDEEGAELRDIRINGASPILLLHALGEIRKLIETADCISAMSCHQSNKAIIDGELESFILNLIKLLCVAEEG